MLIPRPPVPSPRTTTGTHDRVVGYVTVQRNYGSAMISHESGTFSSVKTPNFKAIKRRESLPMNPFTHTYRKEVHSQGHVVDWNGTGVAGNVWSVNHNYQNQIGKLLVPRESEVELKAKAKLLDKLKDSSVNLAQALAERKQTVDLLTKSINRLASAALAIRRGNLNHAVNLFAQPGERVRKNLRRKPEHWKNLDNHWLEFSYGWKPLVSDIYGSAELLAKTYFLNRPLTVNTKARDEQIRKNTAIYTFAGSNCYWDEWLVDEARYHIEFREDSATASRLASTGITNPLLLTWELLPYSFVLDWFLPVGSYLQSLDATVGLTFYRGTKTIKSTQRYHSRWDGAPKGVPGNLRIVYDSDYLVHKKVRTVLTAFPAASFPSFDRNPIGVERALSGISLLTQIFTDPSKRFQPRDMRRYFNQSSTG